MNFVEDFFLRFILKREETCSHVNRGGGVEGQNQAELPLSMEPKAGLDLKTLRSGPGPKSRVRHA